MTEVETFFKPPKGEPRRRAWNSTLPAPKRGGMKQRTARAAADDRSFKAGPRSLRCQRCGEVKPLDASHRATRTQRPDLRGDPSNRDDLCRDCHQTVEASADQARAEGWRSTETYEAANPHPWSRLERNL